MTTATIDPPAVESATPEPWDDAPVAQGPDKRIQRAARVANFNGWATGIVAALSAPFALFSLIALLVFVSFSVVAYNEFRGRRRFLELDPTAARLLGWNQVGLLVLITGYCCWMIFTGLTTPNPFSAELATNADLRAILGPTEQFDALYRQAVVGFYSLVILLSVIFQGANAIYYFTRRKHVANCLLETLIPVGNLRRTTTSG